MIPVGSSSSEKGNSMPLGSSMLAAIQQAFVAYVVHEEQFLLLIPRVYIVALLPMSNQY